MDTLSFCRSVREVIKTDFIFQMNYIKSQEN